MLVPLCRSDGARAAIWRLEAWPSSAMRAVEQAGGDDRADPGRGAEQAFAPGEIGAAGDRS
ncbi:MAG: hypothetical protein ABW203_00040 [Novosphingobium sp.]